MVESAANHEPSSTAARSGRGLVEISPQSPCSNSAVSGTRTLQSAYSTGVGSSDRWYNSTRSISLSRKWLARISKVAPPLAHHSPSSASVSSGPLHSWSPRRNLHTGRHKVPTDERKPGGKGSPRTSSSEIRTRGFTVRRTRRRIQRRRRTKSLLTGAERYSRAREICRGQLKALKHFTLVVRV